MLSEKAGKKRYAEKRGKYRGRLSGGMERKIAEKDGKNSGQASYRDPIWNMITKYQV
jgi:hypothetical protein